MHPDRIIGPEGIGLEAPRNIEKALTTEGIPVSPSMGLALDAASVPTQSTVVDRRVVLICALCVGLAVAAAFVAQGLMRLIWLITNVSFHGTFSFAPGFPADPHLASVEPATRWACGSSRFR